MTTFANDFHRRLSSEPWGATLAWLERDHGAILERVRRLTSIEESYALDRLHEAVPAYVLDKIPQRDREFVSIWRGAPAGTSIRPGDWVALSEGYARKHVRMGAGEGGAVDSLVEVPASDVYWAGTDENEFMYLPAGFRRPECRTEDYLRGLSLEALGILVDGEMARIRRYAPQIEKVREHVAATHDHAACGEYHGQEHWRRVALHAVSVARAEGIDPLVPYIFAWVHDSCRENDGHDPEHGPRAADFVRADSGGQGRNLFGFLSPDEVLRLADACDRHSTGQTEGEPWLRACWDADRLDLARVGITPHPDLLCTDYGRRPEVIERAVELAEGESGWMLEIDAEEEAPAAGATGIERAGA